LEMSIGEWLTGSNLLKRGYERNWILGGGTETHDSVEIRFHEFFLSII
jgi:hypothetical protein